MKPILKRSIAVASLLGLLCAATSVAAGSLRFFGTGALDTDRVKIRVDPPTKADVGATDFTIDFWLRALPGDNAGIVSCGVNDGWITGNVVIDRDIYGLGPDFGIALGRRTPAAGSLVAFGLSDAGGAGTVLCGTSDVADGNWHHVAVQRRLSDGRVWLFVDGRLEATGTGPAGSLAYPDGRATSWPASDPFLVLGAEKHDAGSGYPSFSGWLSELRLSNVLRYGVGTTLGPTFTVHDRRHPVDAHTLALYRFQEGTGGQLHSATADDAIRGDVRFHPTLPRPQWSTDAPLPASPGCLDLDDNGHVDRATDGLLLLRSLLGLRGAALTASALGPGARRTDPEAIRTYVAAQPLTPSGWSGPAVAARHGLLAVRLMAGVVDAELLRGLAPPGADGAAEAAVVRAYFRTGCGLPP